VREPFNRAIPHSVTPDGVLIYVAQGDSANVYRVPFDPVQARVTGPPVPLTVAPGVNFWPSASADGSKVVFGNASSFNTNLWAMTVDPGSGVVVGEPRRITDGLVERTAPFPSTDGKRLVYKANAGTTQDIRVMDIASRQETRLGETSQASPPVISDDGAQVAYAVREKDALSIYTVPLSGGVARRLCTDCGRPIQWFGKGSRILYDQAAKNKEIAVLDVRSGKSTTILRATGAPRLYTPRLSPDGRALSFTHLTGPRDRRTYLVRFSDNRLIPEAEWQPLTPGPSSDEREPFWSPDGRFLYFLSERDGFRCVWAARFDPASLKAAQEPFGAYHLHQFRYSLLDMPDVAEIGLSLAGKTMFLAVREIQSSIWLAERRSVHRP
jgi:Tol biopolymer transport system component